MGPTFPHVVYNDAASMDEEIRLLVQAPAKMQTIRLRTWGGFTKALSNLSQKYAVVSRELDAGRVFTQRNLLLFRGQGNAKWELQTTLDRKEKKSVHVLQYLSKVTKHVHEIESVTGAKWHVPNRPDLEVDIRKWGEYFGPSLPAYDYLIYMRHHGFPSPLLDWTESAFVAAYFAYIDSAKEDPAVYCYIERPMLVKAGSIGSPGITLMGKYITTHRRHFTQKAHYSVATYWDIAREIHWFCSHEEVFKNNNETQDLLFKFILPIAERANVLAYLDQYNINHYTLFQSEDSLIKALATKEFDMNGRVE